MIEENNQQNTEDMQYDTMLSTSRGDVIANEKDPILREIWSDGYTHIQEDVVSWKMVLVNNHKRYIKEICLHEYREVVMQLTYRIGCNLAGSTHTWITESDGSADKFRDLINPC